MIAKRLILIFIPSVVYIAAQEMYEMSEPAGEL
jgi:hypothetical protein